MKKAIRIARNAGLVLLGLVVVLAVFLRLRYGGGEYYPDVSTAPKYGPEVLEEVLSYPEPLGNLAVSADNRLFFNVHPESRPSGYKVLEWKDGEAVPYPSAEVQQEFVTTLGMFIDSQNRLWTIDHGNHGFDDVRLLAFDLATDEIVYDYIFDGTVAETGSFFNDFQVSPNGRWIYVADVSFFGKNPSIVVHDTETGESWRTLERDTSVCPQDYIIQNPVREMTFLGGLIALKPGVDGIAIDESGEQLYYGAMTHDGLYRIPTAILHNKNATAAERSAAVVRIGTKPLSDGLSIDTLNNVYITDVENQGIARMSPAGDLQTLIKDERVRWSDGLSYGGDGYLYFTDSAIPDQMLQSKAHIEAAGPYYIFRFKPEIGGIAGH